MRTLSISLNNCNTEQIAVTTEQLGYSHLMEFHTYNYILNNITVANGDGPCTMVLPMKDKVANYTL